MIRLVRVVFALVIVAAVGLLLGLVYGWVIAPVEYRDVDPADLAREYRDEYVRLVAASYVLDRDDAFARQRLAALGYGLDDVAAITEEAIRRREPLAPALAAMSYDLGLKRPDFAAWLPTATVSPTPTPSPTASASPTPRPSATATPSPEPTGTVPSTATPSTTPSPTPTATPSTTPSPTPTATPLPANTPAPTATPLPPSPAPPPPTATPAAGADFTVTVTRMFSLQENGGCDGMNVLFLRVVDANGNPLDGIIVRVRWDGGQEEVVTGSKGPGRAEFPLYGAYWARVVRDVSGRAYTSEETRRVDSVNPDYADLIQGGYCLDEADCRERDAARQLCYGHYSWEVEFRRSW